MRREKRMSQGSSWRRHVICATNISSHCTSLLLFFPCSTTVLPTPPVRYSPTWKARRIRKISTQRISILVRLLSNLRHHGGCSVLAGTAGDFTLDDPHKDSPMILCEPMSQLRIPQRSCDGNCWTRYCKRLFRFVLFDRH